MKETKKYLYFEGIKNSIMKGVNRNLMLFLIISIFLSVSVSAIGEWKMYGKDIQLSQYQPYTIGKNTSVPSSNINFPILPEMAKVYNAIDVLGNERKLSTATNLIGTWDGDKYLVAFGLSGSQKEMRLYKVSGGNLLFEDKVNISNNFLFSNSIYDLNADGRDEIILASSAETNFEHTITAWGVQNDTIVFLRDFAYPWSVTTYADLSNLVCSDFAGGTCFIMTDWITQFRCGASGVACTYLLFNWSYNNTKIEAYDNTPNLIWKIANDDFTVPSIYFGKTRDRITHNHFIYTAQPRASAVDIDNDGKKEIIFTLWGAGKRDPSDSNTEGIEYPDDGMLIAINETTLSTGRVMLRRNMTEFRGYTWQRGVGGTTNPYWTLFTTTKADDLDNDGKVEYVISVNTWLGDTATNITNKLVSEIEAFTSQIMVLNDSSENYVLFQNHTYVGWINGSVRDYCPIPNDFVLNDFETGSVHPGKEVVIGTTFWNMGCAGDCKTCYESQSDGHIDILYSSWGSQYYLDYQYPVVPGFYYGGLTVFDNRTLGFENKIEYPVASPGHTIDYINQITIQSCSFDAINNMSANCPRVIYADINSDGNIEPILQNSSGLYVFSIEGGGGGANTAPQISSLCWNTGNLVCVNNNVTFSTSIVDGQGDPAYMRVDCFGNGSFTAWSSPSQNPSVTCSYNSIGNFNANICVTDISHYGNNSDCHTHSVSTGYTNCYQTGQNNACENYTIVEAGYNEFGIRRSQYVKQAPKYQSVYGFNWDACADWTYMYGACPLIMWVKGLAVVLGDWIFANFFIFLILILIAIIVIFIKRSMR